MELLFDESILFYNNRFSEIFAATMYSLYCKKMQYQWNLNNNEFQST